MEQLFNLISDNTRTRLEKVMAEQEEVIAITFKEVFAQKLKEGTIKEAASTAIEERLQDTIENYADWYFEDIDYSNDIFDELKETINNGILHFTKTDKARQLISNSIKDWIKNMIDDDEEVAETHQEELLDVAKKIYGQELAKIAQAGDKTISEEAFRIVSRNIKREIEDNSEEWEEDNNW